MAKKNEKLNKLLNQLEKDYAIQKASDIKDTEVIYSGVFALDYVLGGIKIGNGGHFIEFFGAESSGKSTFALHVIKSFQEQGKTCVWIDAENSYDPQWGAQNGVDNDNLLVLKAGSLEEAGDLFVKLIQEDTDLIVVDSISMLIPEEEIDRDTNQPTMALQARVNALICRKINQTIAKHQTAIIFINQLREKVGTMYGNPYTTGGGRALKHLYHTRVEFRAGKPMDIGSGDNKERIGVEINLHTIKNKKGKPHRTAVLDFYYDGKIDNKKSIVFAGIKYGVINFSGKTYEYKDKKAVGKEKFMEILEEKDLKEITREIWKRMK